MELKQSDYERLGRIYGLERDIETLTAEFAKVKSKFRADRNAILDNISAIKKEIASPLETPELGLDHGIHGTHGNTKYPEGEEKLAGSSEVGRKENAGPVGKARGKVKKDTMAVKRTLSNVKPPCDACAHDEPGCCQCEAESCKDRIVQFGDAVGCLKQVACYACSVKCPRLIQGKITVIKDDEDIEIYNEIVSEEKSKRKPREEAGAKKERKKVNNKLGRM